MKEIAARNQFSTNVIEKLRDQIFNIPYIGTFSDNLCIYLTGSFARGDAWSNSDIDIFFISKKGHEIKKLDEIILKADLIKIIRKLGLPDFTGDGEYLTFHSIESIIEELGSSQDDYNNYFTARMLLLLESKSVYNNELYDEVINKIIDVYFSDYPDHESSFTPVFLANDIIRFWKTMCLNYENKRYRGTADEFKKRKARIKNIKLKFSRLTICYSLLCCLGIIKQHTPENLNELIHKSPLERLQYIKDNVSSTSVVIDQMIEKYEWFLEVTGMEHEDLHKWIDIKENRELAVINAKEYHSLFYNLLELTSKDLLNFYTI